MKQIALILIFIFLSLSSIQGLGQNDLQLTPEEKLFIEENPTVYYGYDPGWKPFEFREDGEHQGITREYFDLLSERIGIQFVPHPEAKTWADCMDLFKSGELSVLTCVGENEERREFMNFTKSYLNYPLVIVTRKDGDFVGSMSDLSGKTVTSPTGYFVTKLLHDETISMNVIEGEDVEDCLMKVTLGEADATVSNLAVVSHYLNYSGYENLKIAAPTSYPDMEGKIGVVKDQPILLNILQKGLNSITEKEKNAIVQNWVSVTYEHGVNMAKVWTIAGISLGVVGIIFGIIVFWNRKLKQEISLRKEAEEKLQQSFEEISMQKVLIEEKNQEVLDSIKYAKRLQNAIMPQLEEIDKHIPKNFVLYKPKDIVAGDFYWMEKVGDQTIFIAAADCTGHGVPGAMVSVVCSNALNRSVLEYGLKEPGQILDKTTDLVVERFSKSSDNVKDGMDIGLSRIDFTEDGNAKIKFAGAHNHLWIVSKRKALNVDSNITEIEGSDYILHEVKATKQPVGLYHHRVPFHTWDVNLEQGERFYLYSDGFADQFGGPQGKKFKNKSFKHLLLETIGVSINEQKNLLEATFDEWKSDFEQLDDVCVIGIEI